MPDTCFDPLQLAESCQGLPKYTLCTLKYNKKDGWDCQKSVFNNWMHSRRRLWISLLSKTTRPTTRHFTIVTTSTTRPSTRPTTCHFTIVTTSTINHNSPHNSPYNSPHYNSNNKYNRYNKHNSPHNSPYNSPHNSPLNSPYNSPKYNSPFHNSPFRQTLMIAPKRSLPMDIVCWNWHGFMQYWCMSSQHICSHI